QLRAGQCAAPVRRAKARLRREESDLDRRRIGGRHAGIGGKSKGCDRRYHAPVEKAVFHWILPESLKCFGQIKDIDRPARIMMVLNSYDELRRDAVRRLPSPRLGPWNIVGFAA